MKLKEKGFGGVQVLLVAATIGIVSLVAMPKYQASMNKAKITEALNLAAESKRKAEQSYMVSGHFPKRVSDAQALMTTTVTRPEFVRDMKIEHDPGGQRVKIFVYFNEGVIETESETLVEQFVFMEGHLTPNAQYSIEWRCGSSGLNLDLLPADCQG